MRRRTFLAGMAAAPLASCSSDDGDAGRGGRTVIRYGLWDAAQVPGLTKIARAFERENPDVRVRIEMTPWASYWTTLRTSMRGGTAPDVFWMNAVNIQLYAAHGVIAPLGSRVEESRTPLDQHPAELRSIYTYDGEPYAVPKDFDTVGLWYNKRLFDAKGVAHPDETWTWDDVRSAAAELTDPRRKVYGISAALDRQSKLYPAIFQAGGHVLRDNASGFRDPRTLDGLRFWTDLIEQGSAPPQYALSDMDAPRNMLTSETLAMNFDLSARAGIYYAVPAMKEHLGVAVLPRGRRRGTVIHGLANVISAKSPHQDAAWRFVDFLARRPAQQIQASEGVTISSYEGTQDAWVKSMPEFDLKVFIDSLEFAEPYPRSKNTAVWENQQYVQLGRPFSGRGGLRSSAEKLADQMDLALREENAS